MAQFNFNPNEHQVQTTLEALPRGWYPAIIEESEIVPTANKDGFRLVFTYRIIDGPGKGRKVMKGYNIDNPSAKAVEISMNEIKTVSVCVGQHSPIGQTEELHNRPLQILLTTPKDSDYNDVKGYKTIDGVDAEKVATGAAPAAVGHVGQPPQGYANPPASITIDLTAGWQRQNGYRLNPATNAWEPDTPATPPAPPAPPPPAPATPYTPPAPPATPQAPAWTPGAAAAAPAWAPQK